MIAPFNDAAIACELIRAHRDELAGVIMEPLQRVIAPLPGFLQAVRDVFTRCEIPLIFDEVVTGFRFAWGGAQEYYGITRYLHPRQDHRRRLPAGRRHRARRHHGAFRSTKAGDEGFMPQVGTLSGNPVAAAAGLATLGARNNPAPTRNSSPPAVR